MAIPQLGDTVLMLGSRTPIDPAPAMLTRVHGHRDTADGPVAVNVTAFADGHHPEMFLTVMLFHTEEQARAFRGEKHPSQRVAWVR